MPRFSKDEISDLYKEEINLDNVENYDENNLEDYYEVIHEDDRDGEYYENLYYPLIEEIYEELEYLSEETFDEYSNKVEEVLSTQYKVTYSNKNLINLGELLQSLKQAKQYRLNKNYDKTLSICDEILQISTDDYINHFTINLKIATLGDKLSLDAYELASKYIPEMYKQKDFINTLFGLLAKPISYPNYFIDKLIEFCPFVLDEYISNLGNNNPKKNILKCNIIPKTSSIKIDNKKE